MDEIGSRHVETGQLRVRDLLPLGTGQSRGEQRAGVHDETAGDDPPRVILGGVGANELTALGVATTDRCRVCKYEQRVPSGSANVCIHTPLW